MPLFLFFIPIEELFVLLPPDIHTDRSSIMNLTDTHTHLYLPDFKDDIDDVIQRAMHTGVTKMFLPNIDLSSIPTMLALCKRHPGTLYPMLGLHPSSVKEDYRQILGEMKKILDSGSFIAIGETGIDLYWDKTYRSQQIEAFRTQVEWSLEKKLPIVIHTRESFQEIISVLYAFKNKPLKGVFHSFTGTREEAEQALELGFMLGIGGIATFRNASIVSSITGLDPNRIIIETDAPYLAPVPHRGKRNESAFLIHTARFLAEAFKMDLEDFATLTTRNAVRLFNHITMSEK